MELLIKTLLALSFGGTVLALMLVLVKKILGKKIYSAFVYYAWLLVLLRFILPVPGMLSFPAARPEPSDVTPAVTQTAAHTQHQDHTFIDYEESGSAASEMTEEIQSSDSSDVIENPGHTETQPVYSQTEPIVPEAGGKEPRSVSFWLIAVCVWAAGALCTAGWNLYGYFRWRRALYMTLRPPKEADTRTLNALHQWPWPVLYRSAAVGTPMLMGLLRPVIILPDREYTPEMLDGILRHELTHYRRGDLLVKWFAAGVCCVHWFNPVVYLLRSELDRACELSCDERLLRNMDRRQKQNYGEMLLELAAERALPGRVVAVSFATEKRNLKERLVQIMTFRKKGITALCLMLAVLVLLAGCATAMGPANDLPEDPASALDANGSSAEIQEIYADSVDAFLGALGSNRRIILKDGTYDLTTASDYGFSASTAYYWFDAYDGYELVLSGLDRLSIVAENGADAVSIVTQPRYANVLKFENCSNVTVDGITAGHTPEQGTCSGGVLYFDNCDDVNVSGSVLYGCGIVGITAYNSRRVFADSTVIKECSYGAISSQSSYDVRFTNGSIYDCGLKEDGAYEMFEVYTTTGFAVHNTEIYGNKALLLLSSNMSYGVELRGCNIHDNRLEEGITITGNPVLIDGCSMDASNVLSGFWYTDADHPAKDANGNDLSSGDLAGMALAAYQGIYEGPAGLPAEPVSTETAEDGRAVYRVSNVDDFIGAIGSNRVIYVEAENIDLSQASSYGGYGGVNFFWENNYDGPELRITGVNNMSIIGRGKDRTTIEAVPRYANVLAFVNCTGVTIEDLTAGHVRGRGECSGDVIAFQNCDNCAVRSCGLFGCGVNGIYADYCYNLEVKNTEIYECSSFGAIIDNCSDTVFEGCSIHDCGVDQIVSMGFSNTTWDGKTQEEAPEMFYTEDSYYTYTEADVYPEVEPVAEGD